MTAHEAYRYDRQVRPLHGLAHAGGAGASGGGGGSEGGRGISQGCRQQPSHEQPSCSTNAAQPKG